jgi:hypothetical protein
MVAVMPTMHDKGRLIAPAFKEILDMTIEEVHIDTDVLGTFSGEIERTGTSLETAIKKAQLGIEASGAPYAIASEGSIGPDPFMPFVNADIETMVFIDEILGIQVQATHKSNEILAFTTDTTKGNLEKLLTKFDFPNHAVIVKPRDGTGAIKGIKNLLDLEKAIEKSCTVSSDGQAIIESDLRAMSSPSRQKNISDAGLKLVRRLAQTCPECTIPGWGLTDYLKGVPCSECGEISHEAVRQEVLGCVACEFTALGTVINLTLDPSRCTSCNP